MTQITLRRPDDWHLHLRDGAMLRAVTPETARHFGRAIIMPNLVPPVVTGAQAADYRERIRAAIPEGSGFTPLMTLYLTEETDPADVAKAKAIDLGAVRYFNDVYQARLPNAMARAQTAAALAMLGDDRRAR